jgi:hypothetical protein
VWNNTRKYDEKIMLCEKKIEIQWLENAGKGNIINSRRLYTQESVSE